MNKVARVLPLTALALGPACGSFEVESVNIEGPHPTGLDERPVVRAAVAPPPVYGGTLEVLDGGAQAAVSDPARDRVYVVDLDAREVRHEVVLADGDRPWRIAEDELGDIHVVLRGSGELLRIDPSTGAPKERRSVCANPRGVVAAGTTVYVGCAGGGVVAVAADGSSKRMETRWNDVRDLMILDGYLVATFFRRAQLDVVGAVGRTGDAPPPSFGAPGALVGTFDNAQPEVAWRTRAVGDDAWLMVHQYARPIRPDDDSFGTGGGRGDGAEGGWAAGNSFSECSSPVTTSVTLGRRDGEAITSAGIIGAVVPVDVALSPDGENIAVAVAGSLGNGLKLVRSKDLERDVEAEDCDSADTSDLFEPVLAVDYRPNGELIALTRSPSRLVVYDGAARVGEIHLSNESIVDTGHELFHRDAGGGLACASCHPEGSDDGRIWAVDLDRPARTMPLDLDLAASAPFHWGGDMHDFSMIVDEVFAGGMGGRPQAKERKEAFEAWVMSIPAPAPVRVRDEAARRGEEAFVALGCQSCHRGPAFTQPEPVVGLAERSLQVPLLAGVATRGPFMHDTRAQTLRDAVVDMLLHTRVDEPLPDDRVIDDVVAFLETL